jgi:phosphoribosylformylglycinamidine synthase PurS subunit
MVFVSYNFYCRLKIGVAVAEVLVNVLLKPEILDPQGRAVMGAVGRLGLTGVSDVRQGKQFVLTIDGEIDDAKLAQINEIALTLLSNPVIEDFTVQVRA